MAEAPPLILTGGQTSLNQMELTADELAIFNRDIRRIAEIYSLSANLQELLLQDRDAYLVAAKVAKAAFGGLKFAGLSAAGSAQFGFQLIRAVTIMNPGITSGTPVLTWSRIFTSTGWQNIFGSPTNPVSLAQTGLGGVSATNLNKRVVLAFGALLETAPSPPLAEYRFHVGNTDYPVQAVTWLPATNIFYAKLMGVFLIGTNGSFYMRGNIQPSANVQSNLQLFGLTFATGDYLAAET